MADTMKDFCDYFAEKLSWQNKADTIKNPKTELKFWGFCSYK
jgi:hypothetical protein